MKIKISIIALFILFLSTSAYSQVIRVKKNMDDTNWAKKNIVGFDLNEILFVNWNAGGNSSIAGTLKGNFTRIYTIDKMIWNNELIVRYGLNDQQGIGTRKTDDVLQFNSTVGYRNDTISNWYHSAKLNFNTQFTNGYAYPDTREAISKPLAPAYTHLGLGAEYNNIKEKLNLYISPLTLKHTMVLDTRLADQGAFGVKPAKYDANGVLIQHGFNSRTELGFLFTGKYIFRIMENVNLENRLALYTDYINKFGNIDVNWFCQAEMTINKYVKTTVGIHTIYDDDIKTKVQENGVQVTKGARLQLKQILALGAVYTF